MSLKRRGALSAALGCAFAIYGARADTLPSGDDLNPVVVTATRTAQPLDRTGSAMSVSSAEDLDTQQTLFVSAALAQTPGLSVTRSGGPGQTTSLHIRAAEAGESLILVDRIPLTHPSAPAGGAGPRELRGP